MEKTKISPEKHTKKAIKELLKMIEEKASANIKKALNSGAISEKSEFLKVNHLLAMCLIEDATEGYKIKTPEYRKEAENIKKFI